MKENILQGEFGRGAVVDVVDRVQVWLFHLDDHAAMPLVHQVGAGHRLLAVQSGHEGAAQRVLWGELVAVGHGTLLVELVDLVHEVLEFFRSFSQLNEDFVRVVDFGDCDLQLVTFLEVNGQLLEGDAPFAGSDEITVEQTAVRALTCRFIAPTQAYATVVTDLDKVALCDEQLLQVFVAEMSDFEGNAHILEVPRPESVEWDAAVAVEDLEDLLPDCLRDELLLLGILELLNLELGLGQREILFDHEI